MKKIQISFLSENALAIIFQALEGSSFCNSQFGWQSMLIKYGYCRQDGDNVLITLGEEKLCFIRQKLMPFIPQNIDSIESKINTYGFSDEVKNFRMKLAACLLNNLD